MKTGQGVGCHQPRWPVLVQQRGEVAGWNEFIVMQALCGIMMA